MSPVRRQDVLLLSFAELADRLLRIRRFLQAVDAQSDTNFRAISRIISEAVGRIERLIIKSSNDVCSLAGPPVSAAVQQALEDLHHTIAKWFVSFHALLVYLPRPVVEPEIDILLTRTFGPLAANVAPAVVLGSLYNALEYDFLDVMKEHIPDISALQLSSSRQTVLELALCDFNTPTAWSLLAHELGHAIDEANGISQDVTKTFVPDEKSPVFGLIRNWMGELVADGVATAVLGPALMVELVGMQLALGETYLFASSATHPATSSRVRVSQWLLDKEVGRSSLFDDLTVYSDAVFEHQLTKQLAGLANEHINNEHTLCDTILRPGVDRIATRLRAVPDLNWVAENQIGENKDHIDSVNSGMPISSTRLRSRDQARDQLAGIVEKTRAGTLDVQDARRSVAGLVQENPASPAEILCTAGYVLFRDKAKWLVESLTASAPSLMRFDEKLKRTATVAKKSLEVSAVHESVR